MCSGVSGPAEGQDGRVGKGGAAIGLVACVGVQRAGSCIVRGSIFPSSAGPARGLGKKEGFTQRAQRRREDKAKKRNSQKKRGPACQQAG
jgi:hypothetical protein